MGKLALGLSLVCLLNVVLFFAVTYFLGMADDGKISTKKFKPNFLKIYRNDRSEDRQDLNKELKQVA